MRTLRAVKTVTATVFALWLREVAKLLATSALMVRLGMAAMLLLAAVLGGLLAATGVSGLSPGVPDAARLAIMRVAFAAAVASGIGITVVLHLTVPARTALENLLDLLPISYAAAKVGLTLPLLVVSFLYIVAVSAIGPVIVLKSNAEPLSAAGGLVAYLVLG
jgi:hypothetical protein